MPSRNAPHATPTDSWTFLTNHAHVLVLLSRNPDRRLREVAVEVGITERAVQLIVRDLSRAGFLDIEKSGRNNIYTVKPERPLRHPIEAHRSVADLLRILK